ncbi:snRNA-activating protein complex subunit 1b [Aulostomus maculatus]
MESYRTHVKTDCEDLLSRFQTTDSVRFDIFSKIWREMKFEDIFFGTKQHEKRAFSRLVLDTAYPFFLPPFSFQIRVGGLYLLYSLFHCQTASPPEQIRVALKDWEELEKFEKDCADAHHFDVIFILRQLMYHKAFNFTAMPTQLRFQKKRNAVRSTLCEDFVAQPSRPQDLVDTDLLEEMSNIHTLYEKLKTSAASELPEMRDSGLHLMRTDLVPQLRSTVVDFYKWLQWKDGTEQKEDHKEGTSSEGECSRRAKLLSSIKSKAYSEAAETSESRRHRQVQVNLTSNQAGPAPRTGYIRSIKPSLKARTEGSLHVAGDVWKEAMASTQIHHLSTLESLPEGNTKI